MLNTRNKYVSLSIFLSSIYASFVLLFNISYSSAAVIVGTGEVTNDGSGTSLWRSSNYDEYQFVAFQVIIEKDTVLASMDLWMQMCRPGNVKIKLYSNEVPYFFNFSSAKPGVELQSVSSWIEWIDSGFYSAYHWQNFSGFNWPVKAGTYWIAVEPEGGFSANLYGGAVHPLTGYSTSNNMGDGYQDGSDQSFGFRLHDTDNKRLPLLSPIQLLLLQ